jgi:hypothetical protein
LPRNHFRTEGRRKSKSEREGARREWKREARLAGAKRRRKMYQDVRRMQNM